MQTTVIVTDLYSPGLSDDGTEFTAEVYSLVREFKNGRRSMYCESFFGAEKWENEGSWGYADVRKEAFKAAEARLEEVKDTGEGWSEVEPAYGTQAWLNWERVA